VGFVTVAIESPPPVSAGPNPESKGVDFTFRDEILTVSAGMEWGQELIQTAERVALWEQATIVSALADPYHHADRNNDVVSIAGAIHPDFAKFEELLKSLLHQCALLYKALNKHLTMTKDTGYQLLRYKPGQHFHEHVDNVAGHTTWGQRQLSVVLYLNDDYTGGEIAFPRHKKTIKAKAGDLILFPSHFTHPHASLDVKSGVKHAVVSWFV
jgi:hypothetical protein